MLIKVIHYYKTTVIYLPKYVPKKWSFYYQFTNLIMAFILPQQSVFTYYKCSIFEQ